MYILYCTVYTVYCTLYNVHYTMYIVHLTVYNVKEHIRKISGPVISRNWLRVDFSSLVDEEEMRRIAEERRVERGRMGDSMRCGGVIGETQGETER